MIKSRMQDTKYRMQDTKYRIQDIMHRTSCIVSRAGVTLVELMITLVIFSIVIAMIYSVYNAFLKQATTERKVAKTEMDVINVSWPLIKEIETAGFGVPSYSCSPTVYQCACGIGVSGNDLIIHSTAAGDADNAGLWSFIADDCSITNIPDGEGVVVINILSKARIGTGTISSGKVGVSCNSDHAKNMAYWYEPPSPPDDLECYETTYKLYNPGSAPAMCAPGTQTLGRIVSRQAGVGTPRPMLDCVRGFNFIFGCIDAAGALTWQNNPNCGTSRLKLIKIGLVVQSSPRRDFQVPLTITLFEDTNVPVNITLTSEQGFYKWREIEQTITLKNLE